MRLKTHMLIARKIHEYMEQNYETKINRKQFIFGNIKPDIIRKINNIKHTIHDSLDFVLGEMTKHEHENDTISNPSVHLGMINHYLTDYFCSKHYYKNEDESLLKHIKYEGKIHKAIANMDVREGIDLVFYNFNKRVSGGFLDILRELEHEYKKQPPSIENDIFFAICTPLLACKFLLKESAISQTIVEQTA